MEVRCEVCGESMAAGLYATHIVNHMFPFMGVFPLLAQEEADAAAPPEDRDAAPPSQPNARHAVRLLMVTAWGENEFDEYEYLTWLGEAIGDVPRGVQTAEEREELVEGVSVSQPGEHKCVVCQEEMMRETDVARLRACGHAYCRACILAWLERSKKCPICNVNVVGEG